MARVISLVTMPRVKQNALCSFKQATQRAWQTLRERETYAQAGAAMTDLLLKPAPARGPNDYEVIAGDWIVGRIVLSDVSPAERPWMWSLDHEFYQGREQTHGYEATREDAMQAFARSWHREM
jgi:hypothetical protein